MKTTSNVKNGVLAGGIVFLSVLTLGGFAAAQVCVQPPEGLVSWWPGDGNAIDIISGNHGTVEPSVTFAPGKVDGAFLFNGLDGGGGVNLGNVPAFDFTQSSSFTIDAWINSVGATVPPNESQLIVRLNYNCSATDQSLGLSAAGGDTFFFHVRDANGVTTELPSPTAPSKNAWHHVAGVREVTDSGTTLKLYVDGVLVATAADPSTGPLAVNTPDVIGRRYFCPTATNTFNGLIDEVEVFNRALTAEEIQAIFNAGSAGKCNIVIDIKPESDPNSINPKSKGVISVAILTTETFDASTVDPLTAKFGPNGAVEAHGQGHLEDVDGDGDLDLVLHFRTQDTGIQCGDTPASLTGETSDGQPIRGSDSVNTVGCN